MQLFVRRMPHSGEEELKCCPEDRWDMDELINFFEKELGAPATVIYRSTNSRIAFSRCGFSDSIRIRVFTSLPGWKSLRSTAASWK